MGIFSDNYVIEYDYNENGQVTREDWYNASESLVFYMEYELSPYRQPNYFVIFNPALAAARKFAPAVIHTWYSGTGAYTYEYIHQVNSDNYIVTEDVLLQNGDTAALKLFTYECY